MDNNKWNKYCVMCGRILTGKQTKCCSKECNGKRYNTLSKVRAIKILIDDYTFKTLLNQYPLELLVFGHINNDGWTHRKQENIKSGTQTYLWIIDHPIESKEIFEVVSYRSNMLREIESYENKVKKRVKALNFTRFRVECDNKCKDFDEYNYLCIYNSIGCNLK